MAEWGDDFTDVLGGSPGRTHAVRTDGAEWRAKPSKAPADPG
ncbi:hypothetical protein [Nonomuraea sp. NPDC049480]